MKNKPLLGSAIILFFSFMWCSLFALTGLEYLEALKQNKLEEIENFFDKNQYRLTNRESAYLVARHRMLFQPEKLNLAYLPSERLNDLELNLLGYAQENQQNFNKALSYYQEAYLVSGYTNEIILNNILWLYLKMDRPTEARRLLVESEKLFLPNFKRQLLKCTTFFMLDDLVDAKLELSRLPFSSQTPNEEKAYFYSLNSLIYESQADYQKALTYLEMAFYLSPLSENYSLAYHYLKSRLETNDFWLQAALNQKPDQDGEESLTDRQIENKLERVDKLIKEKSFQLAWETLEELTKLNTLLYARALFFYKAKIILEVNPKLSDLSLKYLTLASKAKPLKNLTDETIRRFKLQVDDAEKERLKQKESIEKWKLAFPAKARMLEYLTPLFPIAARLPLPESAIDSFQLGDLTQVNETTNQVSFNTTLPPAQLVKKKYFQWSVYTGCDELSYDTQGRLDKIISKNQLNEKLKTTVFTYKTNGELSKEYILGKNFSTNFILSHDYSTSAPWTEKITLLKGEKVLETTEISEVGSRTYSPNLPDEHFETIQSQSNTVIISFIENGKLLSTMKETYSTESSPQKKLLKKEAFAANGTPLEIWNYLYTNNRLESIEKSGPTGSIQESILLEWREMPMADKAP